MLKSLKSLPVVGRLAVELAVVVAGVLIALYADSWYDARLQRADEARHLLSLREDFSESLELFGEWTDQRATLSSALLRLLESDLPETPSDSIARWVQDGLLGIWVYNPRLTALHDLETSGEIGLLTPEVRREIAELDRRLTLLQWQGDDFTRSQQGLIDPYLVSELGLAPILAVSDSIPISERSVTRDTRLALETTHARSLMALKFSLAKVETQFGEEVATQLELLLSLIDQRLLDLRVTAGAG